MAGSQDVPIRSASHRQRHVGEQTKIKRNDASFHFPWRTLTHQQQADISAHGNVQHWSLAIETADTGTADDPTISAFTPTQAE